MKIKKTKIIKSIKSIRNNLTTKLVNVGDNKKKRNTISKLITIDEQLYNAVKDNNIDDVKMILLQGLVNIDWKDKVHHHLYIGR